MGYLGVVPPPPNLAKVRGREPPPQVFFLGDMSYNMISIDVTLNNFS
jgi:hypothetical protein